MFDFDAGYIHFKGQRRNLTKLAYPYDSMNFYNKVAYMSTWTNGFDTSSTMPNRICFTSYTKVGLVVSMWFAYSVSAPTSWATNTTDFAGNMVDTETSNSWGILHEYNHQR